MKLSTLIAALILCFSQLSYASSNFIRIYSCTNFVEQQNGQLQSIELIEKVLNTEGKVINTQVLGTYASRLTSQGYETTVDGVSIGIVNGQAKSICLAKARNLSSSAEKTSEN